MDWVDDRVSAGDLGKSNTRLGSRNRCPFKVYLRKFYSIYHILILYHVSLLKLSVNR